MNKIIDLKNVLDYAVPGRPRKHFSDNLKDQGICEWVVYKNLRMLECVPDHFKKGMYDDAVMEDPLLQIYVPDWFVTQQLIVPWDDRLIKWCNGYEEQKAQKASIKEELLSIVWHRSRW